MLEIYKGKPADTIGRQERELRVYELLDGLGVEYDRLDHKPAMTMEVCAEINAAFGRMTLEEFNADPEHYRIDDDDKLNICYKQIKMNEFHFLLLVILCISDDTFLLHKLPKFQLPQFQVIQRIIQKEIHVLYKLFSKTLDSHFELMLLCILANL